MGRGIPVEPRMAEAERVYLVGRWREAVERAKDWARSEATGTDPDPNP